MHPLEDIRAFLAHFEETAELAWDFNVPDSKLIQVYFALFVKPKVDSTTGQQYNGILGESRDA